MSNTLHLQHCESAHSESPGGLGGLDVAVRGFVQVLHCQPASLLSLLWRQYKMCRSAMLATVAKGGVTQKTG